jgi:hypothetical protein
LFDRAPGTQAFDAMLTHFKSTYSIDVDTDQNTADNSLIEYFYYVLTDYNEFKHKASQQIDHAVNIEYQDFSSQSHLFNILHTFLGVKRSRFDNLYHELYKDNQTYLNRKTQFELKLQQNNFCFDLLETAYIGRLIAGIENQPQDWFNAAYRLEKIQSHRSKLLDYHKSMLYNANTSFNK